MQVDDRWNTATRVLFVCVGNICRSPMAEVMIGARLPAIRAESAGISALEGWQASDEAITAMRERNLDLTAHRARSVRDLDLNAFDLVVAMTPTVAARLRDVWGVPSDRLIELDVDDPYGADVDSYRRAAAEIERQLALDDPLR